MHFSSLIHIKLNIQGILHIIEITETRPLVTARIDVLRSICTAETFREFLRPE